MTGLRVKLVTGDVRHLQEYTTSSALATGIQAESRLGCAALWVRTTEGTLIDAMQVVEIGEPKLTRTPGRYVVRIWDTSRELYGVWDTYRDDWERDDGGMEKHDAENIAWNLNGETV